jgi:hypothetical protein
LAAVLPQAVPGCVLRATPDLVELGLCSNGTFDHAFAVPNTVALAGAQLLQQLVPCELSAQLQIVAITATNGLQLTIGAF